MKYLLGILALLVGTKFVLTNPEIMTLLSNNKELVVALAITLASRPFLKRIFD